MRESADERERNTLHIEANEKEKEREDLLVGK